MEALAGLEGRGRIRFDISIESTEYFITGMHIPIPATQFLSMLNSPASLLLLASGSFRGSSQSEMAYLVPFLGGTNG